MADDLSLVVGVDYKELTGFIKTAGQTKTVLRSVAKDFAKSGDQKSYMRSINQIVLAQKSLDSASQMSRSQIMKLGNQMRQEVQFTDALVKATQRLTTAQVSSAAAVGATKNRMNGTNVAVQQLGYQVGDFAVQVQGGTSAFVAFSQQATQLAGVLPLVAAPLGLSMTAAIGLSAALGILIPIGSAVARMFFDLKDSVEKTKDPLLSFERNLRLQKDALEIGRQNLSSLRKEYGNFADEVHRASTLVAQAALSSAMTDYKSFAEGIGDSLSNYSALSNELLRQQNIFMQIKSSLKQGTDAYEQAELAVIDAATAVREHANSLGMSSNQMRLFNIALKDLDSAEGMADIATQSSVVLDLLTSIYKETDNIPKPIADIIESLRKVQVAAGSSESGFKKMASSLSDVVGEAVKLRNAMDAVGRASLGRQDQIAVVRSQIAAARAGTSVSGAAAQTETALGLSRSGATADQIAAAASTAAAEAATLEGLESLLSELTSPSKGDSGSKTEDPIVAFQKQLDLQQALIGKTEEQKALINALGVDYQSKYSPAVVSGLETQITMTNILTEADAKRKEALEEATRQQEDLADFVANSMGDALMGIVDGTMKVKDAFKSMASDIIKELYRVLVVERMVQSIKGYLSPSPIPVPSANGNVFSNGSIQAYANGGVVGGPTYFPMSGGKTGLMGEAGPEAIMPLKRGANGKLGVQMEGGGQSVVVNQSFNFSANGDDSVKKIIAQAAPQIANMTKKSIMDDRRRGGQMKATFG